MIKTTRKGAKKSNTKKNVIQGAVKRNRVKKCYEKSFLKGRFGFVLSIVSLCLVSLIVRATYVQVINSDELINEADKRILAKKKVLPPRGAIRDRSGELLAASVPMYSITADPKLIFEYNALQDRARWEMLSKSLDTSYSDIIKKVESNPKSRFVYLSRKVSSTVADYINDLKITGVIVKKEDKRVYPKGEEIAHLIGYTNVDNGSGIEGIEKSFNSLLVGKAGSRTYRKDRFGHVVEDIENIKMHVPNDVVLSIDQKLQTIVYREIKKAVAENNAESGTAVLVDVQTGEVIAMANSPSYNPNNRVGLKPEFTRNRAITDTFEPGSTVKPFVVLTGLEHNAVHRDEIINTGPLVLNGSSIRDVAPRDKQTLDQILENSSNRGVSRIALRMPPNALMETYSSVGLGKATDLGLVGEQSGVLNAKRKRWSDIERANVAFGYGINATPLQIARAYATLGSFGIYRPLSITKVDPPVIGKRVFSEKLTKDIVDILEKVAIKNKHAMVEGYRVGVKTGTAKKLENGRYVNKYVAFTAGLAPISNPRYALVVLINDPKAGKYYGGAVSAPVFSTIMEYALRSNNVIPDRYDDQKTVRRTVYLNNKKAPSENTN